MAAACAPQPRCQSHSSQAPIAARPRGLRLAPGAHPRRLHAAAEPSHGLPVRRQPRGTTEAAAAAGASSPAAAAPPGRHAFLHDFCMCIPYGALLLAGGAAARLLAGWGQPAVVMMALGAVQVGLSNLSLAAWRAGRRSRLITLTEAGLAGWLAYYAYRAVQQGVSSTFMGALLGLSAAMALFLAYNVAAGGNPPRRGKAAEPAAAA